MASNSSDSSLAGAPAPIWGPVVSVVVIALTNVLVLIGNENSWPHRRCFRWLPTIFFASNRRNYVPRAQRPRTYWALDILDPAHLVQCYCLNTPLLFVLHACTFLYAVLTIIIDVVVDYYHVGRCSATNPCPNTPYPEWFTYFTNWSLLLLAAAALVAAANTARHQRRDHTAKKLHKKFLKPANGAGHHHAGHVQLAEARGGGRRAGNGVHSGDISSQGVVGVPPGGITANRAAPAGADAAAPAGASTEEGGSRANHSHPVGAGDAELGQSADRRDNVLPFDQHPLTRPREVWDSLSIAHLLVMETATTAAFFLTFWFWIGLVAVVREPFDLQAHTFMAHGGNVVLAGLQVGLTRLPIVSYHFQVLLWYGTLYLIFLWIYGGTTGVWRYGLDWQRARPVGAFILLPFLCFLMFLIWFWVAKLREEAVCGASHVVQQLEQRRHPQHNSQEHAGEP